MNNGVRPIAAFRDHSDMSSSSFSPRSGNHCNGDTKASSIVSTAVAISKDKNSMYAVRWAVDNFSATCSSITLIHVKRRHSRDSSSEGPETDTRELFGLYHGYSARKGIKLKEVVVEEIDVAKALLEFVANNYITNFVLGGSTRNALSKKLKHNDIAATLAKSVPDFCNVYAISKGKVSNVRRARRTVVNTATPPKSPTAGALLPIPDQNDFEGSKGGSARTGRRLSMGSEPMAAANAPRWSPMNLKHLPTENADTPMHGLMRTSSTDSTSDRSEISDFAGPTGFGSLDISNQNYDFSIVMSNSPKQSQLSQSSKDLEAEMKRLKLELKQTMDLYSNACKEALSAKKKAEHLEQLKMEEARRMEEARLSEEAAIAVAELEKAKCRAAIEAAEKAQKIAEKEALRRKQAELKAKREAQEKDKALTALHHNDVRYRRYSLTEIEEATNKFADENKIGEGGYGPVFKGKLDHTPVAIKVLRPDATQGKKQFQQEVEVLCTMRHPNMVLLLGACPEYGCLVYEYMDYGSLEDRLFRRGNSPIIPWRMRFQISSEIATALLFLHQAKPEPLVHRDLKPANILLDSNWKSKISDVGLARLVPPSVADSVTQCHVTCAAGTFYYIDPEYQQTGKLNTRSDIYSLGILLLQVITARPPMGLSHQVRMAIERGKFQEMLDPSVTDWPAEQTLDFAKIALRCTELRKKDRPDLGTVIVPELNRLKEFGATTARSHGSSSSSESNESSSINSGQLFEETAT